MRKKIDRYTSILMIIGIILVLLGAQGLYWVYRLLLAMFI